MTYARLARRLLACAATIALAGAVYAAEPATPEQKRTVSSPA